MAINLGRWFRDRKKQAEGVVAQANPFDGGKTYNTVINNTPVAKPVQTQVNTAQPGWSVRTQPTQPSWLQKQNDFNTSLSAITAPKPQVAQTPTTFNVAQQPVSKPAAQQPQNNVAKPASQFSDHNKWQIQRLNETTPMVLRDRNKAIADKYNAINNPNKSAANTNIREQFYRDSDNDNLDRILGGRKFNTREEAFKVYQQGLVEQGLGDKLKQANALVSQHNQRLSQSRNITGDPLAPQTKGTYMNNMDVLRMVDPRTLQTLERRLDSDKATARSGINQTLNNFASGATQTFAKLPVNVVNLGWSLVDTVTPEGSKIDKFAERIKGDAQARAQAIENAYARTGVSQQAGDNPFIAVPASGAGQIASAIATGGTVSGVGVGTDIVSQTQRDMAAHGEYDETKQLLTALPNAVAQGLLEKYGVDNLATPAGKSFLKSVLFKAASEGAQEGSQEFVGNIAKNTYDKSQGLLDNVLESAGWGTLLGGGTGLALDSPRLAQNIQNAPKLNTGGYIGVGSDSNNIQTGDQVVTDLNIKQDPTYQTLDKRAYEALKNADESTGALKQNYQVEAAELIRQRNEYVENAKAMTAPVQQQSTVAGMIARMRAAKARIKPLDNKGFIAGPLALDFSKAQAEGKVFKGVDGKPRFEVDDSGAKIKNPNGNTLGELVDHPELFNNYPELKDVKVKFTKMDSNGEFDPKTNTITINPDRDMGAQLGTILHESQHKIQSMEGFASGGSTFEGLVDNQNAQAAKLRQRITALQKQLRGVADPERKKILNEMDKLEVEAIGLDMDDSFDRYRRLAGEAEARAVQARMDMPMSERYVTPKTADEYAMSHRPDSEGATLDDISQGGEFVPEDVYTKPEWYGDVNDQATRESIAIIQKVRGNPEAEVTVYRAAPKNELNSGDWISLSKKYAVGESGVEGTKVHSFKVKAKELRWPGDSFNEFGYFPDSKPRSTFYDSLDVPKEDLIVRNGDGKAMSVDPLDSLKQEARKYKSVDEFVNSQIKNTYLSKYGDGALNPMELPSLHQSNIYANKAPNGADLEVYSMRNVDNFRHLSGKSEYNSNTRQLKTYRVVPSSGESVQPGDFVFDNKAAAEKYLLEHPERGNKIVSVSGSFDDFLSPEAIQSRVETPSKTGELIYAPKSKRGILTDLYNQAHAEANTKSSNMSDRLSESTDPADIEMRRSLSGKNRPKGAFEIEQNQQMTDEQRLQATGGDIGQAGISSDPEALARAKAKLAEAKAQTPNESTKRPIKPAPAKPLSVVDRVNSINETPKAPTKDKVLASLEKQKRDLIDYEARARYETGKEIAQKQKELRKTIKDQWTGQTDIEDLPRSIKGGKLQGSWAGKSFDELAHDLGFESDSALADELFTHTTQEKLSDLREVVEDTIKRGDSPLSDNYKKLLQEIDDRQAELLRYPEGARALENKPSPKMSKAERESLHASAPVGTERKLKVATPVANKNIPVRKLTQEGDVVTATNVNPDIKATEKRYSIDDNGQMIEDRKGAYRIFNDGEGKITGVRIGKKYYSAKELGDLSDVNDYGSSLATMRRNIERAFGKETGDKLSKFVVDHQQKQATKLIRRQLELKQGTDALAKELGISFGIGSRRAKKVSASIQDYGEGNITRQDLVSQYGENMAGKIVEADKWFKSQYNQLLDEMNKTLTTYGYDPVQKHKNYYTHFQDQSLWSKVGLKMQEIRSLSSPTMQDSMPAPIRGSIDNRLAGQSEFMTPNKRFNPFALQRKGDAHTSDAFQSFERYLTPTLNNIYMTPSITRARVVSQAVAEQANLAGKDANGVIRQMREWANRLAGKTSRIDRPLVDSKWGNTALRASQWAQRKAGANTIVGNLSTAVMQPVVLTQTIGKFGLKNTLLATVQEMSTAHSKFAPIRKSEFMTRRYADLAPTTSGKIDRAAVIANTPLEVVEETASRITWNAAHNDALSKGIRGDAAIKYADVQAEKTLSGRSIGERPELFDAKAPGIFTMYQLEVNNYWQQVGKEMTKAQAARTMAAGYAFNLLMGAINGRSVGFNPIDAILDSIGMLDDEDEDNVAKAKRIAQRLGGELVDSLPFAGAVGTTVMGEQGWKDLMGKDSTSGRFGFSNAPRTLYENPGMLITPFGYNQARKTIQGLETWRKGQLESKSGKKLTDVPQTKTNLAKALAFGKSAIPEVSEYYNNIGQKKTNKNATGVAGIRAENERLNEELRKTLSDDDYAISKMSKADRQKVVDMGIKSQADLDGLDNYVRQQKTRLGMTVAKDKKGYYKTNDAEYNAFKDEYNQKIKDGSYSKAQRIKADYTLSKLKVGSNFSKDSRDLYNVSEKALSSWLATEEKGVDKQKLANELIAYDQALYNAGLISRLKYKGGIAAKSSGRGGKRGGGRGRKSSFSMADFTTNPQLQTQTYQNLNKLLAGTTFKGGKKPSKTGKSGKVAQKQIKVNMKA